MLHRKRKETKQQPDTAEQGNMIGCCLNSFHFLWGKLSMLTVQGTGYQGGSQHVPKTLVLALIFPKEITRLKGGSYKVALTTYTECIVQRNINMGSEYQIVCPTFPSVTRLWVN